MTLASRRLTETTAMVLCAGLGTRLASLGLTVPKVLVDVGEHPLLRSQLDYLWREGIGRVVINAHHRADAIEAFAREYDGPVSVAVVKEPNLLGTAGGVRNALEMLGDDPFFVLYGDVVVDEPLFAIAERHRERGANATVTVYESDVIEGKGTVIVDEDGWITSFVEKQANAKPPALINAGLYLLEPGFLANLRPGEESDFGHDLFPAKLAGGARILAYRLSESVIDVGTPEGLALARARALAA